MDRDAEDIVTVREGGAADCAVHERRTRGERRRSSRGWFEMRARRDGTSTDRRRSGRSAGWAFWRRGQA